jgi:hypothetical protein
MSTFVAIRDGGKTNEEGAMRFIRRVSSNGQGPVLTADMQVVQHSTPNASVDLSVSGVAPTGADLVIAYQNYCFYTWIDALYNLAISANASGNPRIDAIVAYVDLSVVSSSSNNNPGALKFMDVNGTPAGSPVAPINSAIQTAVGAGNPFYHLATVAVANGFSTIVNANITDSRTKFLIGTTTKFLFFAPGVMAVANDLSVDIPGVPQAQTIQSISAYCKIAPTGSSLTMQVYNVTQAVVVASIVIAAGAQSASSTSITNAAVNANDILRLDCTSIGSSIAGSSVSVLVY